MRDIYEQAPRQTAQQICPRCGSSSAFTRLKHRDRRSGKEIETGYEASLFWAVLMLVVSILVLNVLLPSFNREDFGTSRFAGPLPVWAPFALALLVLTVLEARRVFRLDSAIPVQTYRCRVCQYRWDRDSNPEIQGVSRPD